MKARLRRAVPILPACGNQARRAFWSLGPLNVKRSTACPERKPRWAQQLFKVRQTWPRSPLQLSRAGRITRRAGFVNRSDDCPCDRQLNQAADSPKAEEPRRERVHGVLNQIRA